MRPFLRVLLLILVTGTFVRAQTPPHVDYLYELKSRKDFDLLKGKPLVENYHAIECVKLVYEFSSSKLYYLESVKYKWHYRFTSEILNDMDDLGTFNALNYGRSPGRKYILATFNYNPDTKNYFLQFAPPDDVSDEDIGTLVEKVAATFYLKKQFKILLNSTTLLRRRAELAKKMPVITGDDLFKSQVFQSISRGKATGILKFVEADSLKQSFDYSRYILVIHGNSNDIPICRGIITDQFQTPLSHICLLTANRKTPCAFQKSSFEAVAFRKLDNLPVELVVGEESLVLKEVAELATSNVKRKPIVPALDTSQKKLADLKTLSYGRRNAYGAKTCNLAELRKLDAAGKISTPPQAFGIPFYYYVQHLQVHGIDAQIEAMLAEQSVQKNDSLLALRLKKIRKAITSSPMDTALLRRVTALCQARFKGKVRFRSSSNCEDSKEFNGAGLYTSATGIIGDSVKTIEKAIKKVWASLWSMRAFRERDYFNMTHNRVAMGILVHQTYDDELVNGVAITKNLYRDYEAGFVINMQKGEEEVVSPGSNTVSEQLISYMNLGNAFYDDARSAYWISYSSLQPTKSLVTIEELYQLTKQLESVKAHFYKLYQSKLAYKDFGMDVEFKLIALPNGKHRFIIKQARPYGN